MASQQESNQYLEAKETVIVTQPGGDDFDAGDAAACACFAILCAPCVCCIAPLVACCACLSCCLPDDHPNKPTPKPRV